MREIQQKRVDRYTGLANYEVEGVGLPIHADDGRTKSIRQAFLNASMLYYALIAFVVLVTWVTFAAGAIS